MTTQQTTRLTDRLAGFPWPFSDGERTFRYSVNVGEARLPQPTAAGEWGRHIVAVDEDYPAMIAARENVLRADPGRLAVADHMGPACWDVMLWLMTQLAADHPEIMHLDRLGEGVGAGEYRWRNDLLDIDRTFSVGDEASLGENPLLFIGRQVPEDLLLATEREGQIFLDAGLVTFANDWSVKFMMMMTGEQTFRRVNWTFSGIGSKRMDASLETYDRWGWEPARIVADKDWGRVQLRIELEHFVRLPVTGAHLFSIRTCMISLAEIATVPEWAEQLADIVEELPADIATYKGFVDWRDEAMAWLRARAASCTN
ncbi:heme-dependent oxidative N-demethylase subunit alpha family protein [Corynebacterium variabile]|uniref:heme-dependent oxidative N-demethylase subunit alpha family protein n=1 Tax=Corynebacterium variabile TaxID=1727 RepID=UPI003F90A0AA